MYVQVREGWIQREAEQDNQLQFVITYPCVCRCQLSIRRGTTRRNGHCHLDRMQHLRKKRLWLLLAEDWISPCLKSTQELAAYRKMTLELVFSILQSSEIEIGTLVAIVAVFAGK